MKIQKTNTKFDSKVINFGNGTGNSCSKDTIVLDEIDYRILHQMLAGNNNKQSAFKLKIPLSTIQRRTKKLIQKGGNSQ